MAGRGWLVASFLLAACSSPHGPRDVGNQHPRSGFSDGPVAPLPQDDAGASLVAHPHVAGRRPHVLTKATTRAIATRGPVVYYGDAAEDGLYAIPKIGGDAVRIGQHAPVANAIVAGPDAVVWIGSPGDAVLRAPAAGGPAAIVRDHGIFSNLAGDRDVWLTEAHGSGGTLVSVGATATMGASFDSPPRGLAVDADRVIVATQTKLLAIAKGKGDPETLATGEAFASPIVTADAIYATLASGKDRALVRVNKTGGTPEIVAPGVRDTAIALHGDTLYWFDARRPALLALRLGERTPHVVSEDESYERAVALTVDDDGIFLATGTSDDGLVQIIQNH